MQQIIKVTGGGITILPLINDAPASEYFENLVRYYSSTSGSSEDMLNAILREVGQIKYSVSFTADTH